MRRFGSISLSTLLIAIGLMMGCETERIIFEGPYFVRFSKTTETEKESRNTSIKIELHNAGPAVKQDVNITYSISGSAREGIDYTVVGTRGKAKIKSGEFVGNIEIKLINNANNILRSQDVVLTLESIDYDGLKVGQGESAIGKQFTLTIQDDCILGGNYYGLKSATSVPIPGITISSTNCIDYVLSNWDIEIFSFASVRDLTFIDNGDNTITIPPQEEETLPTELATIDGIGVVDPVTRVITITVRLVDFENQPQFSFKLYPN